MDVKSNEDLSHEERERLDREVRELSKKMEALWRSRAESKQWDEVKADLGVYRLSGQSVKEDPRRSSDYTLGSLGSYELRSEDSAILR